KFNALLVGTVFVCWCKASDVLNAVFYIHADPPALFLASAGLLFFIVYMRSGRVTALVAAAVFSSLAPWAKQVAAPTILAIAILLVIGKRPRGLIPYLLAVLSTQFVVIGW